MHRFIILKLKTIPTLLEGHENTMKINSHIYPGWRKFPFYPLVGCALIIKVKTPVGSLMEHDIHIGFYIIYLSFTCPRENTRIYSGK